MERLYAVDDRYLHVQRTDTGVDYTIYDKASMKEIDGGQLDMEISTLAESALEICNSHGIGQNAPLQVADIGILDELQAAQDAAIAIEPPVQENPEPETDIPPDPAISVEARNAYGYTDDAMLPLTKERAMELFERDVPVYLLYGDNTEAMAFEQTEILNHDGIFGIDRADWEAVKEQFPVITENRWQKAFQQNPADSYCIYQLRRDPELAELRFMNSQYLREHGLEPAFDHYEAVYSGSLPSDGSTEARLDDLYMKFNTAHPAGFYRPQSVRQRHCCAEAAGCSKLSLCGQRGLCSVPGVPAGQLPEKCGDVHGGRLRDDRRHHQQRSKGTAGGQAQDSRFIGAV